MIAVGNPTANLRANGDSPRVYRDVAVQPLDTFATPPVSPVPDPHDIHRGDTHYLHVIVEHLSDSKHNTSTFRRRDAIKANLLPLY